MSQKKAQLMVPPTAGRIGAVKAGTCITIDPDGTINAITGSGAQVFLADAGENIWSCNTAPTFSGATNNFFAGKNAGICITGVNSSNNTIIGACAGQLSCVGDNNIFVGNLSGKVENGGCNIYFGLNSGKGSDFNRLTTWAITSSTNIPSAPPHIIYEVSVSVPGTAASVYGYLIRDGGNLTANFGSVLVSFGDNIPNGTAITIPGDQIGGSSPTDDAVITVATEAPSNGVFDSVLIGTCAGSEIYGGYRNTSIGWCANQYANYGVFDNIFIGSMAGQYAAVAGDSFFNVAIGRGAGKFSGGENSFSNTFIGTNAGQYAANHFYQTFVGAYAGQSLTNPYGYSDLGGPGNQLFGAFSGVELTTGFGNSMFGLYAGETSTTGNYNNLFGYSSGGGITTGARNTAFGDCSGTVCYFDFCKSQYGAATGSKNTHVGSHAGAFATGDSSLNTAIGTESNAGVNAGICAFTFGTGTTLPSQANCTYVVPTECFYTYCPGYFAQTRCTGSVKVYRNGSGSVCRVEAIDPGSNLRYTISNPIPGNLIGGVAGTDNLPITGCTRYSTTNATCNFKNTYLGAYSGQSSSNGTANFFGGYRSGGWSTGSSNSIAIGSYAGFRLSGSRNTAIGCCAGVTTTGNDNIFVGTCSGFANTSGTSNIFVGPNAGALNTTGGCNVVLGAFQGTGFTTCNQHVFISDGAGCNRLMFNNSGAMGVGGANYGTAGQVLTSCGNALAPVWTTVSGGSGTVTCVATGTGLSGGPITTSGTVSLANTAVTPGSYTYSSITVDAQGRLTSASSGTTPIVSDTTGISGASAITNVVSISAANYALIASPSPTTLYVIT